MESATVAGVVRTPVEDACEQRAVGAGGEIGLDDGIVSRSMQVAPSTTAQAASEQ